MTTFLEYARILGLTLVLSLSGGCQGREGPDAKPGSSDKPRGAPLWPDYALPARVSLCGQPLDLTRRGVFERLEFEFLTAVNHPGQVALWRRRAQEFFPAIEAGLKAAGLPDDIKYLAVAESDLRPWIVSPAGALGLWQFMPATARRYGLTVKEGLDHRRSPEFLFGAAAAYLKTLHALFGDWPLALAAYNAGEGRLKKALAEQGVGSYWDLDLPRETERYVYRIAAIKIVLENAAVYGLPGPSSGFGYASSPTTRLTVTAPPGSGWPELARLAGCDYKTLRLLNPHILAASFSGPLELMVPEGALRK